MMGVCGCVGSYEMATRLDCMAVSTGLVEEKIKAGCTDCDSRYMVRTWAPQPFWMMAIGSRGLVYYFHCTK